MQFPKSSDLSNIQDDSSAAADVLHPRKPHVLEAS